MISNLEVMEIKGATNGSKFIVPKSYRIDSITTEKRGTVAGNLTIGTVLDSGDAENITVADITKPTAAGTVTVDLPGVAAVEVAMDGTESTAQAIVKLLAADYPGWSSKTLADTGEYEVVELTLMADATASGDVTVSIDGGDDHVFSVVATSEVETFTISAVAPTTPAVAEVATFTVTGGATGAGNIVIAGEVIAIDAADDTAAEVAAKIFAHAFADWTVTDPAGGASIAMTAKVAGVIADVTAVDDTGGTPCGATFSAVTTDPAGTAAVYGGTGTFTLDTGVTHAVVFDGTCTTAELAAAFVRNDTPPEGWTIGGSGANVVYTRTAPGPTAGAPGYNIGTSGVDASYVSSVIGTQTLATDLAAAIETDYAADADWTVVANSNVVTFTAKYMEDKVGVNSYDPAATGMIGAFAVTQEGDPAGGIEFTALNPGYKAGAFSLDFGTTGMTSAEAVVVAEGTDTSNNADVVGTVALSATHGAVQDLTLLRKAFSMSQNTMLYVNMASGTSGLASTASAHLYVALQKLKQ